MMEIFIDDFNVQMVINEYKYYFLTTVYNESGVSSRRKITDMSVYFALHVCANSCYEVTKIIALIGELEQTCLRIEIL